MKHFYLLLTTLVLLLTQYTSTAQMTPYGDFHGKYDFTMFGNTLNLVPNGAVSSCTILTQSSANLNLTPNQTVHAAYLYWSGSGSLAQADLEVKLNGVDIVAERTWTTNMGTTPALPFFGAFADVTEIVQLTGNGTYLFSDMDLTGVVAPYCSTGLNFGGWAIIVVFEDQTLTNNRVIVYDGFERMDGNNQNIYITLSGLNVIDTQNSKLGFLAWEGDENISVTEELRVNNLLLSNPPLNPANNVFNCTNSFTGANNLWNMDLDFFYLDNHIEVGDTTMDIHVRTGQDGVIFNSFVVNLSSELPDATATIDDLHLTCDSREVTVDFTVNNSESTLELPAETPIAIYANNLLHAVLYTPAIIPIDESISMSATFVLEDVVGDSFLIEVKVDDDGTGNGVVDEISETNNIAQIESYIHYTPKTTQPADIVLCDDDNDGTVSFNLTEVYSQLLLNDSPLNYIISFFESESNATNNTQAIPVTEITDYAIPHLTRKTIWVRVERQAEIECPSIHPFELIAQRVPLYNFEEPLLLCKRQGNSLVADLTTSYDILKDTYDYIDQIELEFYYSKIDAENSSNPIINIENFTYPQNPFVLYAKVKGKNELWCENIIEVEIYDCNVPKGISPNGDGLNDNFDLEKFRVVDLKIYNRYGKVVYEHGLGYTNQWFGQDVNGVMLPSGTYFYVFISMRDTYTGYVQLFTEVN